MADPIGGMWLALKYDAEPFGGLAVKSQLGSRRSSSHHNLYSIETYPENMRPADTAAAHLQFHLRHEPTSLELLARVFAKTGPSFVQEWINNAPTGQYARRASFLYEFVTGQTLLPPVDLGGNYVSALDASFQVTASPDKMSNVSRWRVRDNMPGNRSFCPFIPLSSQLKTAAEMDVSAGYGELVQEFGESMLARAAVWLTNRESKASFTIEGEEHQLDRIQRFSHVLATRTGHGAVPLTDTDLADLQRNILGDVTITEHFGLRLSPVFVGEYTMRYENVVHYLAPPAQDVADMLGGLKIFLDRTEGQSPVMRSAVAAFGFVYIHPLSDGNGRVHRFLINDVLRRDGAIPDQIILPISATIIGDPTSRRNYDQILDRVSKPLMRQITDHVSFDRDMKTYPDGIKSNLDFSNPDLAKPAWRYINFAPHVIYLSTALEMTIKHHMKEEAIYLRSHHNARQALKELVEMPDMDADRIIRSLRDTHFIPSGKIQKEYPMIEKFRLWNAISEALRRSFSE
ncbi:Fic family protein [Komagataeibacter oboediens]|uniref:Fic family protein n=1 Tax=Komagataeibacter oboediens TaxID=65958 RepID=UPI000237E028|nr:Fic family protein [Komagataeibacter oboediens]